MSTLPGNIHPVSDGLLQRDHKEALIKQRGHVIWLTGLSGSGKTTTGIALERELNERGFLTQLLDGDSVRTGINNNLGFSEEDRKENIRRIAEVSRLFVNCGIITINCFVSPTEEIRKLARNIIGEKDYTEIYVNTPLAVCEQRDVKGLYAKARKGELKNFTGIDAPFEEPVNAAIEIHTVETPVEEAVSRIIEYIEPRVKL
jgi:adenylylsulfate kinase